MHLGEEKSTRKVNVTVKVCSKKDAVIVEISTVKIPLYCFEKREKLPSGQDPTQLKLQLMKGKRPRVFLLESNCK